MLAHLDVPLKSTTPKLVRFLAYPYRLCNPDDKTPDKSRQFRDFIATEMTCKFLIDNDLCAKRPSCP
jgi:hypothetical protein